MINKYLTLGIAGIAILGFFYLQTRIDSAYKKGFESGSNKEKSICKEEKLELKNKESLNNEKIIKQNVEVIKRERKNINRSVNDDIKFLRQNLPRIETKIVSVDSFCEGKYKPLYFTPKQWDRIENKKC